MDPFLLLDRAREQNLSETSIRILLAVSKGETSQSRIALTAKLSRAAISLTVKSLVTRELLSKSRSAFNETKVVLQLTQTGKDMVTALTAADEKAEIQTAES